MAQIAQNTAREVAKARRQASYSGGKAGLQKLGAAQDRTRAGSGNTSTSTATAAPTRAPAQTTSSPGMSSREASRVRREAMSQGGKAAIASKDRTRSDEAGNTTPAPATSSATTATPAPAVNETKRDCGCGCNGDKSKRPGNESTGLSTMLSSSASMPATRVKPGASQSAARAASLARRQAMSSRGKAAIKNGGPSEAQAARASNPNMTSRDLAQQVRENRSKNGKTGPKCEAKPCGPTRRKKQQNTGGAQDAHWKVGEGETTHGQTVTGTMVGRSVVVTGDEPSTCRAITGTEYMGADLFREFCQTDTQKTPRKVSVTSTATGNTVSGNELGRSSKVTGDEPGTCKNITGVQYVGAAQAKEFCGTSTAATPSKITSSQTGKGKTVTGNNVGRSNKVTGDEHGSGRELTGTSVMQSGNGGSAPAKVGQSATLRGGSVTGTMVGRNQNVTGDEPGSCRNVTGDDYVGQEQYSSFCKSSPKATDLKVGVSQTLMGKPVTGTMTGRDAKVTGDEPGTCKAVSGTPYAGAENYQGYCGTEDKNVAMARALRRPGTPGMPMTGLQPGINGVMTGAQKGACEPLTGTPYVGADQFADACPSVPAGSSSADFPQAMSGSAPWTDFSTKGPSHASMTAAEHSAVTGTQYEKGHITGPFGMAGGKVTGTEEARFGNGNSYAPAISVPPTADLVNGRAPSRISGEGQDTGLRITGDDWDRNEHVTGTEGLSSTRRNPTRRGMDGMAMQKMRAEQKRNEEIAEPVSRVTGGSGNTEKGSLITYSGGARG